MAKKPADGPLTIQQAARMLEAAASYRYNLSELFRDFVSCAAITLENAVAPKDDDWHAREKEYLEIVARYDRETVETFAKVLGSIMVLAQSEWADHFGELYMALGTGSKGLGQFFTPYHISKTMAAMCFDKKMVEEAIADKGFVLMNEPTCGAGGMVMAAAEAMVDLGYDPSQHLRIVAQDVDLHCCRMTYVACVLHNIPAQIIWGDTLKMEQRRIMPTPALVLQLSNATPQAEAA